MKKFVLLFESLIHLLGLAAWIWLFFTDVMLWGALTVIIWSNNISSRHSPHTRQLVKDLERELEDKLK